MRKILFSVISVIVFMTCALQAAWAQGKSYIQIEAQPGRSQAEQALNGYRGALEDLNLFELSGGWYGIALGPYEDAEALRILRQLRAARRIPRDSYVQTELAYGDRLWPEGGAAVTVTADSTTPPATSAASTATAEPADETPRQARASEALLSRDEKKELQVMLQWAGFYNSGIDGSFGRGTRAAMSAWQQANGFDPTGVLTTRQRAELARQYNAVLEGMDLRRVDETRAGISIDLPTGAVKFDRYDSPFVHFEPTGKVPGARVLLISQPGDRGRLAGLYEIMQTLEIVPLKGERSRQNDSFVLTGSNDEIVSYTQARLENGAIKGFTLTWPVGDEERRTRILNRMKASFATTDAVLDPAEVIDDDQRIDLVAGLQIRKPSAAASGFFVDRQGRVVTSRDMVQNCTRITLNTDFEAEVIADDAETGVAVLRAKDPLAPMSVAAFRDGTPRLQSDVAVSGYSFGGVLPAPTLTYGKLEDLRGLSGEQGLKRLAVNTLPGDAGGPVLDSGGAVLGMLLPRQNGTRQLPGEVSFAMQGDSIRAVLERAGVRAESTPPRPDLDPVDLTRLATEMTVLVSCWR